MDWQMREWKMQIRYDPGIDIMYLRIYFKIIFIINQSQSHITTDDQSDSESWFRAPSGAHDQMLITVWQLLFCRYRAPLLTISRVCHLS
jgi:hypothetical protein